MTARLLQPGALDLSTYPLCYLATPYTKYPDGIEEAHAEACKLAARLLVNGVMVYSPIAHTHAIAVHGKINPLDHAIWLPFDEAMMQAASVLVVAEMPSWQVSYGIRCEIEWFMRAEKPILYLDPETLKVSSSPCVVASRGAAA